MNCMEQVAQSLGIELGEEFSLKNDKNRYKITKNGMFCYCERYKEWVTSSIKLMELLTGESKIFPKLILTDEEREYLSDVINPFRDRVINIAKIEHYDDYAQIMIEVRSIHSPHISYTFGLPEFDKVIMYKGMKANRKYALDDLGL